MNPLLKFTFFITLVLSTSTSFGVNLDDCYGAIPCSSEKTSQWLETLAELLPTGEFMGQTTSRSKKEMALIVDHTNLGINVSLRYTSSKRAVHFRLDYIDKLAGMPTVFHGYQPDVLISPNITDNMLTLGYFKPTKKKYEHRILQVRPISSNKIYMSIRGYKKGGGSLTEGIFKIN